METMKQIIKDTYDSNIKLKEQVELYNLSLDDVGLTIFDRNPRGHGAKILDGYNSYAPIVLYFSKEDGRMVMQSVSFVHPLTS